MDPISIAEMSPVLEVIMASWKMLDKEKLGAILFNTHEKVMLDMQININTTPVDASVWARFCTLKIFVMVNHICRFKSSDENDLKQSYILKRCYNNTKKNKHNSNNNDNMF